MNEITQTQFLGDFSRLRSRVDIQERLKPEFYACEVESIFRRAWLPIASMTDLPNDNYYVVAEVPPLKTSLIVARGDDGKVRPSITSAVIAARGWSRISQAAARR